MDFMSQEKKESTSTELTAGIKRLTVLEHMQSTSRKKNWKGGAKKKMQEEAPKKKVQCEKKKTKKEKQEHSQIKTDTTPLEITMKSLQCHFNWEIIDVDSQKNLDTFITEMTKQYHEHDLTDLNEDTDWKKFYLACLMSYCYALQKQWSAAHNLLDECEENSKRHQKRISSGLLYIVNADRAIVHYLEGDDDEAQEVIDNMICFEKLDASNRAAVQAVRAISLKEQNTKRSIDGLVFISEAVKLDPDYAEWHFLKARMLMHVRVLEQTKKYPSKEELMHLEKAVKLGNEPTHLLFFAQILAKKAKYLWWHMDQDNIPEAKVIRLNQHAIACYHQILRAKPNCYKSHVACGDGLMNIPKQYGSMEQAWKCYKKALELAPYNSMVHHKAGLYFETIEKDSEKAREFYERSIELSKDKNFQAQMNFLNLEATKDQKFNPFPFIQDMLDKPGRSKMQIVTLLICRGLFHYKSTKNIGDVSKDFSSAASENASDFEPIFSKTLYNSCFKEKLNLSDLLRDLQRHPNKEDDENKKMLTEQVIPVVKKNLLKPHYVPAKNSRGRGRGFGASGSRGRGRGGRRQ